MKNHILLIENRFNLVCFPLKAKATFDIFGSVELCLSQVVLKNSRT